MYKFELEDKVKHVELHYRGTVTVRAEYSSGKLLYGIRILDWGDLRPARKKFRWVNGNFLQKEKNLG